jgi:SAM-dependent methyltransferase
MLATNSNAGAVPHTAAMSQHVSSLLAEHAAIIEDPATGDGVRVDGNRIVAVPSGRGIDVVDGIPNFFVPADHDASTAIGDVTDMVRAFYEETPFPNYDGFDSRESLATKARRGVFAALLDQQLPHGCVVFEAGCGTGQLSNFLGMSWERTVFAGDLCLNSLRLAKGFADRHAIRNVAFVQMNLFRPPFRDESFDVVISNGVLHHTDDCERAFRAILAKLKPGGVILVGLYNYYARLPTLWKAQAFRTLGPKLYFLDPRLRDWHREPARIRAWFRDQYEHPHETRHSMDEVLRWFERYGVEFLNGIPHVDGTAFSDREHLFEPHAAGTSTNRVAAQLAMLLSGGQDGGLFIMIGRKREGVSTPTRATATSRA